MKNLFVFPATRRGQQGLEYGIIAAGTAVAILAVIFVVTTKSQCPSGQSTFDPVPRALMTALVKETIKK